MHAEQSTLSALGRPCVITVVLIALLVGFSSTQATMFSKQESSVASSSAPFI